MSASTQIKQLQVHFSGLNTAQKKEFIVNLQKKLKGNTSPEYRAFLNKCISTYNVELQNAKPGTPAGASGNKIDNAARKVTAFAQNVRNEIGTSEVVANAARTITSKVKPKRKNLKFIVLALAVVVIGLVVINVSRPSLTGVWICVDLGHSGFEFLADGRGFPVEFNSRTGEIRRSGGRFNWRTSRGWLIIDEGWGQVWDIEYNRRGSRLTLHFDLHDREEFRRVR